MDIVEVTWLDAQRVTESLDIACTKHIQLIKRFNMGYCLSKDRDKIVLCSGFLENAFEGKSLTDTIFIIPMGIVQNIKKLK